MIALAVFFAILNAADGWCTYHILRFGGSELWGPTKWIISKIGTYWGLMVFKITPVLAVWYAVSVNEISTELLAVLCIVYGGVVVWNYIQLQKHKVKE